MSPLGELIIINRGEKSGEFELGSKGERLDRMTDAQLDRLKNMLSSDAIIDLRMCYGVADKNGEIVAQRLANKLQCRIRAYGGQVSPFGIQAAAFETPKPKIFYPK